MFPSKNHLGDFRRNPLVVLFNVAWFATRSSNQGSPPATHQQPASNPQCGPRHVRRMKSANTLGRSAPCCEDLAPKINVQFGILGDICSKLLGMFQTVKNTNSLQHGHCIPQTWPNLGPRAKKTQFIAG